MSIKQNLADRLKERNSVIGIIGLGYVGLPLACCFAEAGYKVTGFDIDPVKSEKLNRGVSYIRHFGNEKIRKALAAGFRATTNFSESADCDALIICVPTPLNEHREPDLSFVINTMASLVPFLREGQVVSLESTTYPGTTEEELKPMMESAGLRVGGNAFLVYSPEREDPGNPNFTTRTIPKVVGGSTAACLEVGMALYGNVIEKLVPVGSTRAAEMTKLLENIHRAVNIGLVNEMKTVADKMGINIYEVIDAAATKPFGFVPYYPGPGLGGHCIPIDPFYLTWKAREYGINTRFIELAGEINSAMPGYVTGKVAEALNSLGKAIRGSKILILGIAYKPNVDDMRESPSVEIMEQLRKKGGRISYSDPWVPVFPPMRAYRFDLESLPLDARVLSEFDCVVIGTNHEAFDYELIAAHSRTIVDARGVFRHGGDNIFSA